MKSKITLLFALQVICIFLGAISPQLTYLFFAISIVNSIIIGIKSNAHIGDSICISLIWLYVLQNLMIGLGAKIGQNTDPSIKLLTQIPSITLIAICLISSIKNRVVRLNKADKLFIIYLSLIISSLLFGRGSLQAIAMNIRNMTIFYFIYKIGKNYLNSQNYISFYNKLMTCASIVLLIGVVLLIGGYDLYNAIGINEVYIAKGTAIRNDALDDRFYTSLISTRLPRMGSLYYEPVNLAYFFLGTLLASIFSTKQIDKKNTILNSLGLTLTLGKGGILTTAIVLLFAWIVKKMKPFLYKTSVKRIAFVFSILVISVGVIFSIAYYQKIGAASSPHFWAVIKTWKNVISKPFGHGVGTGGNMSQVLNATNTKASYGSSWLATGGESALMSFLYQIGIPAVIVLFLIMNELVPIDKKTSNYKIAIFWFLPIALMSISILQDNTFTPQCVILPMIIIGYMSNSKEETYR